MPKSFKGLDRSSRRLREIAPDGGFAELFAGLDGMRTIPRWTLNNAVLEDDAALGEWSTAGATR